MGGRVVGVMLAVAGAVVLWMGLKAKDSLAERASEALTKASHKMAEALYRDAQAKGAGATADPASGGSGNGRTKTAEGEVVDAEFEDLGPKN